MKRDENFLHQQLIKLGDMLGDGDCEPWVAKEYRRVCRALGYTAPRQNNADAINRAMQEALKQHNCHKCSGALKQSRNGSKRAVCVECGTKFQFKSKRVRA